MATIKCSVTECQYNANQMCDAPMIQVNRNGASRANSSAQTQCETFKTRG
ncbi:DUF1540 domain-containing protein [Desulfovirgula thermocuniculi]|nr:DUF1540 domain-containing protein [Desulfovirgula thermocuniculi]